MSDDDDANAMLGGLFKGAVYYIVKPLTMDSLINLRQFAFINNRDAVKDVTAEDSSDEFQQENTSSEGLEIESSMKKEKQIRNIPETEKSTVDGQR